VFTLLPMISGKYRAAHGRILDNVAKLVEAGKLRPLVDGRHFGFTNVEAAFAAVASGRAGGKVVVDVAH
jgi:NADPH:quinone reductase-like Zn-dependent oxidoreductase